MEAMEIMLRRGKRKDGRLMGRIERECFGDSWRVKHFLKERYRSIVADSGEGLIGCVLYRVMGYELQIGIVAVLPPYRRWGVGTHLVQCLKEKVDESAIDCITAEVHEGNLEAQLFFRTQGFLAIGIETGRFGGSDAYVMAWEGDLCE